MDIYQNIDNNNIIKYLIMLYNIYIILIILI